MCRPFLHLGDIYARLVVNSEVKFHELRHLYWSKFSAEVVKPVFLGEIVKFTAAATQHKESAASNGESGYET